MFIIHLQITERNDVVNGVEKLAHSWKKGKTRYKGIKVITEKKRMMSGTKEPIP
jgi:hypothetical protein